MKKRENKNRRYTHNRPYHGVWWEGTKESNKAARKLMKALRHKLLFHIPLLTDEEGLIVKETGLTEHSQLSRLGGVKQRKGTTRWRFLNPKEENEK